MKKCKEVVRTHHNVLNKGVENAHEAFESYMEELPSKEKHHKFAQMHHAKGTTHIMGEKI